MMQEMRAPNRCSSGPFQVFLFKSLCDPLSYLTQVSCKRICAVILRGLNGLLQIKVDGQFNLAQVGFAICKAMAQDKLEKVQKDFQVPPVAPHRVLGLSHCLPDACLV